MNKDDSLIISKKQASYLSAALLVIFSIVFVTGYIIGQRKALNEFNERLHEESFADRVRYTLYSAYGNTNDSELDNDPDGEVELALDLQTNENNQNSIVNQESTKDEQQKDLPEKNYYAQLFGCGTLKTAQDFVSRVKKLGIETIIKERKSKNSKGKIVRWYQLITKDYDNKQDLQRDVDKIQAAERLQQVKIVEV